MNAAPALRGRLAPSPTGYMHLGNAWAFLLAWLAARSAAGQVVLRIEDIDPQRSRPEYTAALIEDLTWLGLDWDFGPDKPEPAANAPLGPFEQSQRGGHYAAAIAQLERAGLTYPCFCTRKELRSMAGAPHVTTLAHPTPEPAVTFRPQNKVHNWPLAAAPACACAAQRGQSNSPILCLARNRTHWPTAGATLPCGARTVWWPTSWLWQLTMRSWA